MNERQPKDVFVLPPYVKELIFIGDTPEHRTILQSIPSVILTYVGLWDAASEKGIDEHHAEDLRDNARDLLSERMDSETKDKLAFYVQWRIRARSHNIPDIVA